MEEGRSAATKQLLLGGALLVLVLLVCAVSFTLIYSDNQRLSALAAESSRERVESTATSSSAAEFQLLSGDSSSQQAVQVATDTPRTDVPPLSGGCEFPGLRLPANSVIYAAGAYSGRKLSFQIDQSGHEATQIDIIANQPDNPVVLMLGAYEPTVWNISWTPETKIVAAFVSGYHRQALTGLPDQIPVLISSYDNGAACGYFYLSKENLPKLNPLSRRLFGQPVNRAYMARNGVAAVGIPLMAGDKTVNHRASPESFKLKGVPLAGEAGLDEAVRNGIIRPAMQADVLAWQRTQQRNQSDSPPLDGAESQRYSGAGINAYVVLKPFTIPAGLYGAHSATFYVPKGVPLPRGSLGHSTLYDMNTGTCRGTVCGMR